MKMNSYNDNNSKSIVHLLNNISDSLYPNNEDELKAMIASEGLDPDEISTEVLKRIKKIQLQINAEITKNEMINSKSYAEKAVEYVKSLMNSSNFSFAEFIKTEKLSLQNRNIETFTNDDVKSTMIKYFTLKFLDEDQNKKTDEL